jgi:hypothetical protein
VGRAAKRLPPPRWTTRKGRAARSGSGASSLSPWPSGTWAISLSGTHPEAPVRAGRRPPIRREMHDAMRRSETHAGGCGRRRSSPPFSPVALPPLARMRAEIGTGRSGMKVRGAREVGDVVGGVCGVWRSSCGGPAASHSFRLVR